MDHVILFEARVRLSPSQNRHVQHGMFSDSIDSHDGAGGELAEKAARRSRRPKDIARRAAPARLRPSPGIRE